MAIGYLRGRAFACFKKYLGNFLSNEEGHRKKETDEVFGNFQVFEDRLRLLFRRRKKLSGRKQRRNTHLSENMRTFKDRILTKHSRHVKKR